MNMRTTMTKIWNMSRTWQLSQIYGTLIFLGLTIYFLLMYAAGLVHVIGLRFLNVLIMAAGVYYVIRHYRRTHGGNITYFRGITLGTATAFIGITTFGFFLFFFLMLDDSLMQSIRVNEAIGRYLNPYIAACVVMLEGVFSGFAMSYLLVNFMNTEKDSMPQGGIIPLSDRGEDDDQYPELAPETVRK